MRRSRSASSRPWTVATSGGTCCGGGCCGGCCGGGCCGGGAGGASEGAGAGCPMASRWGAARHVRPAGGWPAAMRFEWRWDEAPTGPGALPRLVALVILARSCSPGASHQRVSRHGCSRISRGSSPCTWWISSFAMIAIPTTLRVLGSPSPSRHDLDAYGPRRDAEPVKPGTAVSLAQAPRPCTSSAQVDEETMRALSVWTAERLALAVALPIGLPSRLAEQVQSALAFGESSLLAADASRRGLGTF